MPPSPESEPSESASARQPADDHRDEADDPTNEPAGPDLDPALQPTGTGADATPTDSGPRKLGTLEGVFTPTVLTIVGVILYLRQGWVVGNAGLGGAIAIIVLAFGIVLATALSMSSVTTNIRMGAGGAYSIISKSLGLEIGGAIGIPLYLAQALAVTMYVFGFRGGWLSIFPDHPALVVDLVTFAVLVGIAMASAGLAFKIQYVIMALIVGSIVSVVTAAFQGSMTEPITWWGQFPGEPGTGFAGTTFWVVFAVFFPAATGIMAGANLSGDLEDPGRSIPRGTIAAIGVSLTIYLAMAYWLARSATVDELVSNYTIMVDLSAWGPAVLAGLLGATFSSALSSIVGAPRILQALAEHRILPGSSRLVRTTDGGQPRNAMVLTVVIVLAALMLRDLNAVAPLISMFFLITYLMLNVVVLVEQRLGLVSFRPVLRVPFLVPLVGAVGCIFAMFIVNPPFAVAAVVLVIGFYLFLVRRNLDAPYGDVRSGLFVALAEWAAKRTARLQGTEERAWKANLLVPIEDTRELRGTFRLIQDIAGPKGSLTLMGLNTSDEKEAVFDRRVEQAADAFRDQGVFANWTSLQTRNFVPGIITGLEALGGAFFQPNVMFLRLADDDDRARLELETAGATLDQGLGMAVFASHPKAGMGQRETLNLWLENPDWASGRTVEQVDLAVLMAYKLVTNWNGRLNVFTVAATDPETAQDQRDLERLMEVARIPAVQVHALKGSFQTELANAPQADLTILGLPRALDLDWLRGAVRSTRSSCLFVRGSGHENALA